ncbi:adenylosuccinate synthetase, partial [Myxococcota bacterium]|nr:adenylosuccinate synthetase [Myxococcota bacterium]
SVAARELAIFEHPDVVERWTEALAPVAARVVDEVSFGARLSAAGTVVFEGAQGVLLDEDLGFPPHTTWSRCTAVNALELLGEHAPAMEVERVGVLRSHAVRHGAGPLPTQTPALDDLVVEHNVENPWQGRVRRGWLDLVLARYALAVCGVDRLVLTHVDLVSRLERIALCPRYAELEALPVPERPCPEGQGALTELLRRATPVLEHLAADEAAFVAAVERHLGRAVDVVSRGPTDAHVGAPRR